MKKLFNVFVLTLAANFLAVAGAVAFLYKDGRLDRKRFEAIRLILYPPPVPAHAATQPSQAARVEPVLQLGELLAQKSGLSTAEQLEFIQQTFDARMAELDRRQRELVDLQRQVDMANAALARDRTSLDARTKELADREQLAATLAADKNFQDTLKLYQSMPARQVKQLFMAMDDETATRYLQAMEPRGATKIIKEFKSPDEVQRVQRVLEKMRGPATRPATPAGPGVGASAANDAGPLATGALNRPKE
jgi:flagellar motility protein MotE (MotC chaperone)